MTDLQTAAQQALDSINELFTAEQSEGGERSGHIRTPATREHLVRIAQARKALHESCGALRAALAQQAEAAQDQDVEDAIEAAYWQFDCRKKGLNEWASAPQSERDAFKAEARKLVRGYFPTRQAQDTKREMLAVADAFIRGKRAALAQQDEPVKQVKTCAWRANLDAIYETECGNLHIVNDGTLEENGMKYCCYCGKEIEDESPT